jgi:hypothetical protein
MRNAPSRRQQSGEVGVGDAAEVTRHQRQAPLHYECGRCNQPFSMPQTPITDPLTWRSVTAPSLVDFEILANEVYRSLPKTFRTLCADLVIRIEDFPTIVQVTPGNSRRVQVVGGIMASAMSLDVYLEESPSVLAPEDAAAICRVNEETRATTPP